MWHQSSGVRSEGMTRLMGPEGGGKEILSPSLGTSPAEANDFVPWFGTHVAGMANVNT